jgi:hypothetical protein
VLQPAYFHHVLLGHRNNNGQNKSQTEIFSNRRKCDLTAMLKTITRVIIQSGISAERPDPPSVISPHY